MGETLFNPLHPSHQPLGSLSFREPLLPAGRSLGEPAHLHAPAPAGGQLPSEPGGAKYSLEGLMLKLNLQYFGPLMRRADSFEKTLILGKIEGRRRRGRQRMRWLDGTITLPTKVHLVKDMVFPVVMYNVRVRL